MKSSEVEDVKFSVKMMTNWGDWNNVWRIFVYSAKQLNSKIREEEGFAHEDEQNIIY
jgi:hypothetical protein